MKHPSISHTQEHKSGYSFICQLVNSSTRQLVYLFTCLLVNSFTSLSTADAHEVSTEVQKKNILLEEFTGIHCGNCPEGHKIANNLVTAQEGTVYTIAIHSGHYAVPNTGEPDYRIPEGESFDAYFQANDYGYPSGMINRKAVTTSGQLLSLILGRGSWTKAAKEVHKEDAPVNLWMNAAFEGSSRTLTVDVEAYYTADSDSAENFMNLAITQSNIIGPQSGGLVGDNYVHRHQLKAFITPLWGDTIHQPLASEYFTKRYVYTLPEEVNGVPVKAEDIDVLAFVTAGKGDVLNVIAGKPSYLNYTKPLKIALSPPKEGYASRYAFNFFELNVKNESHHLLTAIDFNVKINNTTQPVAWTGDIPAYQSRLIRLDVQPYAIQDNNSFEIEAVEVNETPVSGARLLGTFIKPNETTPYIFVDIKPDNYADENIYTIKDRDGQVVHTFGPYPVGSNKLQKDSLQLEANQIYCFEVADLWGDGVSGGYVKLKKSDTELFAQNLTIPLFGDRIFFATTLPDGAAIQGPQAVSLKIFVDSQNNICLQGDLSGLTALDLYALDGQCVWKRQTVSEQGDGNVRIPASGLSKGIYLLKINRNNQRETFKILMSN